ncbi:unnamed protein product [Didymodactylos carnosus]|uniref:Uncharacterized protein n=1 Tax=Didymodactylos carnosus TaxID=1234261 RepID=A0A8S2GFC5_9BILA|nr:unnamed protein product [Didymodactylos carnosus]CAF3500709.1 unnamed protein product [Didymodactylos carnosus]
MFHARFTSRELTWWKRSEMDFLHSIKFYSDKTPKNIVTKQEAVDWAERLQTTRRSIIDQLSRLKIEEMYLRNLSIKHENDQADVTKEDQNLRLNRLTTDVPTTTIKRTVEKYEYSDEDDKSERLTKRARLFAHNEFVEEKIINETPLDLDL